VNEQPPPKSIARRIFGASIFSAARLAERILPPPGLRLLVKVCLSVTAPAAILRAPELASRPGLPLSAPDCAVARRADRALHLARALEFFPDRLALPKWSARCRWEGIAPIENALAAGRPVVLAFSHAGPSFLLRAWLRARGIAAATLVKGHASQRSAMKRRKDRVGLLPHEPHVFYTNELRAMTRFLTGPRVLLVAIDHPSGRTVEAPVNDEWSFEMATGAIRVAAERGAELAACGIFEEAPWQFCIVIGEPVPRGLLDPEPDIPAAARLLLRNFLDQWRRAPADCAPVIFQQFRARGLAPERVPAIR
jgi:hypothetical protein